ncbi:MAG: hypothetical protein FJ044_05615 [Candidatus Cloacimonetes bacterium]|nr:hypothetical protein [Candidatus Cloacimonadota bacterium]
MKYQIYTSKIKNIFKFCFVILFFTFCFLNLGKICAQDINPSTTLPITLFPAIQDIDVQPGGKTRFQIQFRNNGDAFVVGQIKVADYIISDKKGTPILSEDPKIKPKYGAASWIKSSYDEITIPPSDFVTADFYVTAPQEISSCGKYAIVYFQPSLTRLREDVDVSPKSASAVTVKVGGLINFSVKKEACQEELSITNLSLPKFVEYGPIEATFDLSNLGDIHINPQGYVVLTNVFKQVSDQKTIEEQRIFPETAKTYKTSLGNTWMFGRYKLAIEVTSGTNKPKITLAGYVWAWPWRFTLVVVLALVILFLLARKTYLGLLIKEAKLEKEVEEEKEEIEKLKEQIRKKKE